MQRESVAGRLNSMKPSPFIRLCYRKRRKVPKRLQVARPERQQRNMLICVAIVVRSTCLARLPVCIGQSIHDLLDESVGWTLVG